MIIHCQTSGLRTLYDDLHNVWCLLLEACDQGSSKLELRSLIDQAEQILSQLPQADHDLEHYFCDGLYMRLASIPGGCLFSTPVYMEECILNLLSGKIIVITDQGLKTYSSPAVIKTEVNVKRLILALTDVVGQTVHPNPLNITDPSILESRIYSSSYHELVGVAL
jgi:hypothetical protein